jgi:hypothetical protein
MLFCYLPSFVMLIVQLAVMGKSKNAIASIDMAGTE